MTTEQLLSNYHPTFLRAFSYLMLIGSFSREHTGTEWLSGSPGHSVVRGGAKSQPRSSRLLSPALGVALAVGQHPLLCFMTALCLRLVTGTYASLTLSGLTVL